MEIWKDVVGYEGSYEVSNFGRVRSLDRLDSRGHNLKGKALKLCEDGRGYEHVKLYREGRASTKKVHQLVAESFIGPRPQKLVVDHIDNDPFNNRVENLQYISIRLNSSKDTKRDLPTGVSKLRSKYQAQIQIDGRLVYLGMFETPEAASKAYLKKLLTLGR